MEFLSTYYGVDIVAMVLTFYGIYYLGNKDKNGFLLHIGGNVLWFILGVMTKSPGLIVANVVFMGMSVRAYLRWKRGGVFE